jgi:hypothetical protein
LIDLPVAEKVSACARKNTLAHQEGRRAKALQVLKRAGSGKPPVEGDELPAGKAVRARKRRGGTPASSVASLRAFDVSDGQA